MPASDDISSLIDQLVAIHGEEGICPTANDWRAILGLQGKGPIRLLNLLKFRPEVITESGPISGADAYRKYSLGVAQAFARVGGERIFFGQVGYMFAFGDALDWDAAVLTRYPSAGNFLPLIRIA